jgi:hypothetical protein
MEQLASDTSNVNPLALIFLVAMSVVMFRGSRAAAVQALLAVAAFLPLGQQVVLFGLHFQFFRILIVIGFCRVLSRGENRNFHPNTLDKLFIAWGLIGALCGAWRDPGAIMGVNCLGSAFNAFGTYFLVRFLMSDVAETVQHMRLLSLVAVVIALSMFWEFTTHKNLFSVFGGVPEFVGERDGRFRCQGPFRHPILAGTFAATLLPLLIGLWFNGRRERMLVIPGIFGCVFSTIVAASSGALLTCITAIIGFSLWPMRERMSLIRRAIVITIVLLALVMNAPVYYIIARLSDVLGGTGWHRSYLIDQAIGHFSEWWLVGTSYTAHWAPAGQVLAVDPNNMDITNHYIAQAVQGGLLRLGLFIAIIVNCFKLFGRTIRSEAALPLEPKTLWALGVCLACHCTAFISISYFDQIEVFWFWLLAVAATIQAQTSDVTVTAATLEAAPQEAQPSALSTPMLKENDDRSFAAEGS